MHPRGWTQSGESSEEKAAIPKKISMPHSHYSCWGWRLSDALVGATGLYYRVWTSHLGNTAGRQADYRNNH